VGIGGTPGDYFDLIPSLLGREVTRCRSAAWRDGLKVSDLHWHRAREARMNRFTVGQGLVMRALWSGTLSDFRPHEAAAFVAAVADAKSCRHHVVIFVTGVPGLGKALRGLNTVFATAGRLV
jgi:hypothetical protein